MRRALQLATPTDSVTSDVDSLLIAHQMQVFGVGKKYLTPGICR